MSQAVKFRVFIEQSFRIVWVILQNLLLEAILVMFVESLDIWGQVDIFLVT